MKKNKGRVRIEMSFNSNDVCVCCGQYVPEGQMVCSQCDSQESSKTQAKPITREQVEQEITEHIEEINKVVEEYTGKKDGDLDVIISNGCMMFNNLYWDEDNETPLNYFKRLHE